MDFELRGLLFFNIQYEMVREIATLSVSKLYYKIITREAKNKKMKEKNAAAHICCEHSHWAYCYAISGTSFPKLHPPFFNELPEG